MDKILSALEEYREENFISQKEMARMMGLSSQQVYAQWITRGSVPRKHIPRARRILSGDDSDSLEESQYQHLAPIERLEIVEFIIASLEPKDRAEVLRILAKYR